VNQAVLNEAPDAVFSALADPTRRRVLRLVAERGPTSATLLERELPVTRQAIVKHLAVLNRAGLVTGRRVGQEVHYALVAGSLDEVSDWIAEIGSRWDERLARLRQVVLDQTPAAQDSHEQAW
jgi:DNA-binding transcriptional ArsR family regulator